MSLADIVVSIACFLQPFLLPQDVDPLYTFAVGNTQSCTLLGFMMRFPLAVALYCCYLSLYFNYSVRKGWREGSSISLSWEIVGHIIAFGAPIIFGTIGIATDSYNPLTLIHICDTGPWPPGCGDNTEPCTRGENYLRQDWCYLSFLLLASLIGIWNTISVYLFVRRQIQTSRQHTFRSSSSAQRRRPSSTSQSSRHLQGRNSNSHQRSTSSTATTSKDYSTVRQVAHQSVLYTLAYLNGFLWAFTTRIIFDTVDVQGKEDQPKYYIFVLGAYLFFPLQGFWNSYIYIRPRILLWKTLHPKESATWIIRKIFSEEEPIDRRRSFRRSASARRMITGGGGNNSFDLDNIFVYVPNMLKKSIDSLSMSFKSSNHLKSKEFTLSKGSGPNMQSIDEDESFGTPSDPAELPMDPSGTTTIRHAFGCITPPKSMVELSSSSNASSWSPSVINNENDSSRLSSSNEVTNGVVANNPDDHLRQDSDGVNNLESLERRHGNDTEEVHLDASQNSISTNDHEPIQRNDNEDWTDSSSSSVRPSSQQIDDYTCIDLDDHDIDSEKISSSKAMHVELCVEHPSSYRSDSSSKGASQDKKGQEEYSTSDQSYEV